MYNQIYFCVSLCCDILYSGQFCSIIQQTYIKNTGKLLSGYLLSTHPPPHYWVNVDKGTPSQITNQAVLIVAQDQNGTPSSIPVAAPEIYFNFQRASYSILASCELFQIWETLKRFIASLNRLVHWKVGFQSPCSIHVINNLIIKKYMCI